MHGSDQGSSWRLGVDQQGRRLGVLGIGVLVVLVLVAVFALKDLGEVIVRLAEAGTPVLALSTLAFAVLAGYAKVVEAFRKPMETVARIVELRRNTEDDGRHLASDTGAGAGKDGRA